MSKDSNDKKRTLFSFFQPLSQPPTSSSPSGSSQVRANSSTSTPATKNNSSTPSRATKKDTLKDGRGADWSGAVRAIAEYQPYLYAILSSVEADDLLLSSDPNFLWKSSLSSQGLKKGRTKVALPSFHFELTATLLSCGICLSNAAAVLVSSLGSYEVSSSVSSAAISTHDETVNQAADMLCRASGVFLHLAETVIPRWEAAVGIDSLRARPVEFTRDAATALSKMCLADANLLAIRRLLSRSLSVAHSTTTPGPPLPTSHPSPSLLSKLHLQVYSHYDEARSLLKSSSSTSTEISPLIRRYLSDGRQLALSLAYKWLGVDNGERSETGEALGWLSMASKALDELNDKDRGVNKLKFGKGKSAGKARKGKVQEEIESVQAFTKAYKKVNDTVHFQPIPSAQTLQARLPSGRPALSLKPYSPSPPAFRPTGPANGSILPPKRVPPPPSLEGLSLQDADDSSDDDEDDGNYLGAGQYF
ncbi:uncharacterized protein JCM6883_001828 [Sporobolomyces salmoneus]|uniref:uncharacterized protein n=1 Tax=Sporobolomyces salmoneus TaxID=183962 RepID=UPI003177DC4A